MCAVIVCLINAREYLATPVGTSRELCEKRRKQVMEALFIGVSKIKIEIGYGSKSSVPQRHYVLNDCGAVVGVSSLMVNLKNNNEPKDALP